MNFELFFENLSFEMNLMIDCLDAEIFLIKHGEEYLDNYDGDDFYC